ncbi:CD3324 family protein [Paeniclostridium sordellii]|nr:CD3324 family protein [Paeniclostridium sordellii]MCQ4696650.1 CD3324 family protein [Paeniclostridium sordellii]MDU2148355.1 CD3324 family protein [Paeniclostridium sordellii]MDU4414406.1 CD3324 family protein [Paeniclostridium sordellii]MDU6483748.1 CD3324 family protein [Paeniclostridium sordellii]
MYNLKIKENKKLKYKNAKNLLPNELLEKVQEYIQGDVIYIPKLKGDKIPWGAKNGARKAIYTRNKDIFDLYINGYSIEEIINIYNLSESSIRKIISKIKKETVENANTLDLGGVANE